jgi:hypothetical protein
LSCKWTLLWHFSQSTLSHYVVFATNQPKLSDLSSEATETSWSDQNDLTTVLLRFCVVGFHIWALLLRKQFCSNLCCSAQRNILRLYIAICKTLEFCSTAELDISTDWKLCNTCDKLWMLAITGWHWPTRTDPAAPLVTPPFSSTPPTNCNKMHYFMKSDL